MKRTNKMMAMLGLLVTVSMVLAACAGGAPATDTPAPQPTSAPTAVPATKAPAPTDAPAPTNAPEPTALPAYEGLKTEAESCDYGGEFKAIEAVDASTVKFTLCTPDPAFLAKIAFAAFAIQDKDYLDEMGGDSAKMSEAPNGTGPYMLAGADWKRGESITFKANPNYWGGTVSNDTLIFRWSSEAAQRLVELQAGTVDGIDNPGPDDFATIEADSALKLFPRTAGNVMYIGMNNTIAPFDNEKVRQAVAMSINKQYIVDNFYPVGSSVAEQFVPTFFNPGYSTSGDGATWYPYDPEAAKALLAEAGFPDGFEVTLAFRDVVRGYLPQASKVAQEIQAELGEVGIKVTINVMESGAYLQSVAAGEQPLFMLGWGMDYPDSTNFYDFHFTGASDNFGEPYPDLVAEIRAAAALSDPAERQKHYDLVNALVKQHVPMIPVAHGGNGAAFKASVENVIVGPLNENFFQMKTDNGQVVWMQNAEPISLWCGDETDGETLRACQQVYESLYAYEIGGSAAVPSLAESYDVNGDLTEWTFHLRPGVTFHNGAELDANDVVATFVAQWDYNDPNHKGNTGVFEYFGGFFGAMLNAPPPAPQ